ncbi:hypothetical protein ACO1O0_008612 [Amphichorda felina]
MVSLTTCMVAGIHYLIHPQKLGTITATINPDSILPVTLLTTDEIFGGRLEQLLDEFDRVDDVFVPDFGGVLVEKAPGNETNSTYVRVDVGRDVHHLEVPVGTREQLYELPSGPYILHGPNVYQAWRLYEDSYEAFDFGVIPENVTRIDRFRALNALSPGGVFKSIPVPSRLYYPNPSTEKPLAGVRFSISDAMSLKGARTTLSSRAWASLYPSAADKTARYAQKLMDLGAVIVGKTKVSQFASGEQWVDVQGPWNPRADQYQDPSGSSAGAGVALAGYEWLEYAVGEDAIDGLRSPAAHNGVYSLRSSFSNDSLDGVRVSSSRFDSIGLAARSLEELLDTATAILDAPASPTLPRKIVYLDNFAAELPKQQLDLMHNFVGSLEQYLGVKAQRLSLGDIWDAKPPSDAGGQTLQSFMKDAPFRSFCYDYAHEYQDFRAKYHQRFDREPYVEATPRGIGGGVAEEEYKSDLERIQVFQSWFNDNVVPTDSSTVVIFPSGFVEPDYRHNKPSKMPDPIEGVTSAMLAPILGAPELVVPFAHIPYESKVSWRTEYLPVSGSVLGAPGSDTALIDLVKKAFEKAGRRAKINTGRFAFPVEKNARSGNAELR